MSIVRVGRFTESIYPPASMRPVQAVAMFGAALAVLLGSAGARAQNVPRPEPPLATRFPPRTLPYDDGEQIPPGYHLEDRVTKRNLALGGAMFGAAWLPSAFVAAAVVGARQPDAPRLAPLAIPIAGPFITIMTAHAHVAGGVVLALDGIAQVAGVTLFVAGLKIKEPVLVLNPIAATARLSFGPGSLGVVGAF